MWTELIAEARERGRSLGRRATVLPCRARGRSRGTGRSAARLCDEAMEIARQTGREQFPSALPQRSWSEIAAHRGEVERVRREIPDLLQVAERTGIADSSIDCVGRWRRSSSRAATPVRLVTRRAPLFARCREMDEYLAQLAGSVAIEALIGIGDLAGAERLLTVLDSHAAGSDTAVGRLACRCRGLLLAARGEHARAIEELEAAASDPDPPQGTNPFERARTLLALGSVQRRAQHKRAARETLELAADELRSARRKTLAGEGARRVAADRRTDGIEEPALGDRAAHRRARRRGPQEQRGGYRAQPQPEHGRVEPVEDLSQARSEFAN